MVVVIYSVCTSGRRFSRLTRPRPRSIHRTPEHSRTARIRFPFGGRSTRTEASGLRLAGKIALHILHTKQFCGQIPRLWCRHNITRSRISGTASVTFRREAQKLIFVEIYQNFRQEFGLYILWREWSFYFLFRTFRRSHSYGPRSGSQISRKPSGHTKNY